ncbi:zinc finger MYM-type protein 5 isoform X2 [Choloepus didactylus]|uniref:zinc finger MYM-type protein 5 isoform X2 n=1 Tax=Choloepus didactylus TaxID=27675 RepID=UPI00189CB46D|nr:zinc finger MYM-type protein 5 isoform X2 [Choloepus didactylus]
MDKCSVGGLELTEQTPVLLGSTTIAASLMDVGNSFGNPASLLVNRSRNSSVEDDDDDDDDVVFVESIQPPSISAPAIPDQRNVKFTPSKNAKLQGKYSVILPSSRDFTSQKGNKSETIVIDDEEDIETNQREEKNSSSFTELIIPETKIRTKDLDFSISSLSRRKTKTGLGPFNPDRINVAGDVFQNGGFATQHNPGKQFLDFPVSIISP